MKNKLTVFLMFLSMVLTVSCGKDYNALFQERIAELNKEGKYILNQYNDSVGKEHYIVYLDMDKIVVDTLGDSLQVFPLHKLSKFQYKARTDKSGKFVIDKEIDPKHLFDGTAQVDLKKKRIILENKAGSWGNKTMLFKDLRCMGKDCVYSLTSDGSGTYDMYIFFLGMPGLIYYTNSNQYSTKAERGGFEIIDPYPYIRIPSELIDYKFVYKAKMSSKGILMEKDDYITFANKYRIPVSAFAKGEIDTYFAKIAADLKPTYYWNCQNCYKVVKSESKPESGFCEANFFTGSTSTWTFHHWVRLCKAGSLHTYQCQDCGVQVKTNEVPQMGACSYGGNHVWNQLQ